MSQRLYTSGVLNPVEGEGVGKPSVNSAFVVCVRPEAKRACPEQDELWVKPEGGPN